MAETATSAAKHVPCVVIVGGGFGGLHAAKRLSRTNVDVVLIDRRNFHLFQPLLYQVATGALSPANIASPLRNVLRRQKNVRVLLDEVTDFDLAAKQVLTRDGSISYDTLVVAAGSTHSYFGHDDWQPFAPGLKSIEDATVIRGRVLGAFEFAERMPPGPERDALLTFAVVGGGPTGVELAGQIAEIARRTLVREFRSINSGGARVLLIEAAPRPLASYSEKLSRYTEQALADLGIEVLTKTRVTAVDAEGITVSSDGVERRIATRTKFWAAGVQASPLGAKLGHATGAQVDRHGRVVVEPDLTLPGRPEIFVIGDLAQLNDEQGKPLPGVAPVAIQQGKFVADVIANRQQSNSRRSGPFRYHNHGTMATIGRLRAVADLRVIELRGVLAWIAWLFLHLMTLVTFQNRLLVLLQWAGHFVTGNRSARLITNVPRTANRTNEVPGK
jgi:NADH dehydrogenase